MGRLKSIEREIALAGRRIPLRMTWRPSARRLSLRIDPASGGLLMTLPQGFREREALSFLERHEGWAQERLERLPPRVPFLPDAEIPFRGRLHPLRHAPQARRGVWIEEGVIHVSGQSAHFARRVQDYLKAEARSSLNERVEHFLSYLPEGDYIPCGRITLRDTKSRWGSCSAKGDLSFSWRLILAPTEILDYVAAHEVCHLMHPDHSPAFWSRLAKIMPQSQEARAWLKREGNSLLRYG